MTVYLLSGATQAISISRAISRENGPVVVDVGGPHDHANLDRPGARDLVDPGFCAASSSSDSSRDVVLGLSPRAPGRDAEMASAAIQYGFDGWGSTS
jgi:hypothetical protein